MLVGEKHCYYVARSLWRLATHVDVRRTSNFENECIPTEAQSKDCIPTIHPCMQLVRKAYRTDQKAVCLKMKQLGVESSWEAREKK